MKPENVIEVRDLKKKFKVYYDKGNSLKEKVLFKNRNRYEERWVLKGISFEVKRGEAVGLIGHNGCGKSTTLKLLNRIIYPSSGDIEMRGRVSSLIELGAGFHPDMSGRENIYINASIFGLTKKEIDERIDDIIAFSELEDFMDNPVRTYSSGMYMRLAFAVAINVDADILLIDEILAVGDANFQAKCFNKLREIKGKGVTIVIVSHALGQIEQICERSIWIHEGKIRSMGSPGQVHPLYMDFMADNSLISEKPKNEEMEEKREDGVEESQEADTEAADTKDNSEDLDNDNLSSDIGNFDIKIKDVQLVDIQTGEQIERIKIGSTIALRISYIRHNNSLKESECGFHIFRNDGVDCYGSNTLIDKIKPITLEDKGEVCVILGPVFLLRGDYKIDVAFHSEFGVTYHHRYNAVTFQVVSFYDEVGVARIEHKWLLDNKVLEMRGTK